MFIELQSTLLKHYIHVAVNSNIWIPLNYYIIQTLKVVATLRKNHFLLELLFPVVIVFHLMTHCVKLVSELVPIISLFREVGKLLHTTSKILVGRAPDIAVTK